MDGELKEALGGIRTDIKGISKSQIKTETHVENIYHKIDELSSFQKNCSEKQDERYSELQGANKKEDENILLVTQSNKSAHSRIDAIKNRLPLSVTLIITFLTTLVGALVVYGVLR